MSAVSDPTAATSERVQEDAELARLHITRVPADNFLWNGYKYSRAEDAIAAARRETGR